MARERLHDREPLGRRTGPPRAKLELLTYRKRFNLTALEHSQLFTCGPRVLIFEIRGDFAGGIEPVIALVCYHHHIAHSKNSADLIAETESHSFEPTGTTR